MYKLAIYALVAGGCQPIQFFNGTVTDDGFCGNAVAVKRTYLKTPRLPLKSPFRNSLNP
jgi:hypothetical protein